MESLGCGRKLRKLELMGADVCARWHYDSYCGRAIATYNLSGTEYVGEDPVKLINKKLWPRSIGNRSFVASI